MKLESFFVNQTDFTNAYLVVFSRVSVGVLKEVIEDVSMTPDQKNIITNAIKNISQGQDSLNLDEFCGLFQNVDSVCNSLLPRKQSKCKNTYRIWKTVTPFSIISLLCYVVTIVYLSACEKVQFIVN